MSNLSSQNKLHVTVSGTGPVVLLVHGFPLDHTMWAGQLGVLSDEYTLVAPDLRGFGQSPPLASDQLTMGQCAEDLMELIQERWPDESVVLCGLSMGGYIAWEFWKRYRGRLRGLVLCDTRAAADSPEVARGRQMMAMRVIESGADEVADVMLPKLFANDTVERDPLVVERINGTMRSTSPATIAAAQRGLAARESYVDRLPSVDLPCLCVCGEQDVITPTTEMREMAGVMPRATYVEIPHAGHMAPLEQPKVVNAHLREFLASL
ncbi:MAG: alpha/beta fold hydrolase [Planctomycetales bacterium]|nr:alpha/beta fold hydrolase [Planctomycetales bacterium]